MLPSDASVMRGFVPAIAQRHRLFSCAVQSVSTSIANPTTAIATSSVCKSHVIMSLLSMSSLRSVVVVAPTHVLVDDARGLGRRDVERGRVVEAVLEDRLD